LIKSVTAKTFTLANIFTFALLIKCYLWFNLKRHISQYYTFNAAFVSIKHFLRLFGD